jgi:hypothetical protein
MSISGLFSLFDRAVSFLQRLTLDYDLSNSEAKDLAEAVDKVNDVRDAYATRKLGKLQKQ